MVGVAWAAVQRRHSLLKSGNIVNLHLQSLQAMLIPVLQGVRPGVCTAFVLLLVQCLYDHRLGQLTIRQHGLQVLIM